MTHGVTVDVFRDGNVCILDMGPCPLVQTIKIDNDAQGTSLGTASLKAFAGMVGAEHLPCHHECSSLDTGRPALHRSPNRYQDRSRNRPQYRSQNRPLYPSQCRVGKGFSITLLAMQQPDMSSNRNCMSILQGASFCGPRRCVRCCVQHLRPLL
jgi:hypothetical protein